MKFIRFIFSLIITCCFLSFANAQYTAYPMLNVGYVYQNQSFGELGAKVLFIKKDEVAFRAGASVLMGATRGEFSVLPKIQGDVMFNFRENVDVHQGFYYIVGAECTTKYFAPYVGISALGLFDFIGGYAFSYHDQFLHGKELKGLRLGITFNLPLAVFK